MKEFLMIFFNKYELKAIIAPGMISIMSFFTTLIIYFPDSLNLGSSLIVIILLIFYIYLFSIIARENGKMVEKKVVFSIIKCLSHYTNFKIFRRHFKYKNQRKISLFLQENIPCIELPSYEDARDKKENYFDDEYDSAIDWLLKNTREDYMTAQHNMEYGFYRNLLGIKYIGIIIVLISIVFSIVVFILSQENVTIQLVLSSIINVFFCIFGFLKLLKHRLENLQNVMLNLY
ncbi:hypothetical protein NFD60_09125 [Staphylococcus epidermidis]|nr:hypothetical protein NFD60_09125 [Staphylococcus epidermidis]